MILLSYDGPRYMRYFEPAYGQDAPLISGLIAMLDYIDAKGKSGIEIGSFAGESSEITAQYASTLQCVDAWDERWILKKECDPVLVERQFDAKMQRFDHVTKHKGLSVNMAKEFADQSVDFVYIDGWHAYDTVCIDIDLYLPKVCPGGWLCGHDYDEVIQPGVCRAVNERFGRPDKVFVDSSWAVRKDAT